MRTGQCDLQSKDFIHDGRTKSKNESGFAPTGYSDSKLMMALLGQHMAKLYPNKSFITVCPGFCGTDLSRHLGYAWWQKMLFAPILAMVMRSAERGSHNIVHAVMEDDLVNGGFYQECKVTQNKEIVQKLENKEDQARELYELSCELIKK